MILEFYPATGKHFKLQQIDHEQIQGKKAVISFTLDLNREQLNI